MKFLKRLWAKFMAWLVLDYDLLEDDDSEQDN